MRWVSPGKAVLRGDSYPLGVWGQNARIFQAKAPDSTCPPTNASGQKQWPRHSLWGPQQGKLPSSKPMSLCLEWEE